MMSIYMTSPQEWITTIIIIIVTTHPMRTAPIMKKTKQPIKMAPSPTKPMKTAPTIRKISLQITNKRRWIIILEPRYQEWDPLKKQKYWKHYKMTFTPVIHKQLNTCKAQDSMSSIQECVLK